jgi:hypothetical protein
MNYKFCMASDDTDDRNKDENCDENVANTFQVI